MKEVFLSILLSFCLTSCDQVADNTENLQYVASKNQNNEKLIGDVGGVDTTGDTLNNNQKIKIFFDYPVLKNIKTTDQIKIWGENLVNVFRTNVEAKKSEGELHGSFQIFENTDITTVYYDISMIEEKKANPIYRNKLFYIDNQGNIISESKIFRDLSKREITSLTKIIESALRKKYGDVYKLHFSELENLISKKILSPQILFDNQDAYFLFDFYEVGPRTLGAPKIHLEFSQLSPYLNKKTFTSIKGENGRAHMYKENKDILEPFVAKEGKKYVALSFDDGPNNRTTPKLIEILKNNDVRATFFVLGKNAQHFPDIVKSAFNNGNEIASHSWDHPDFTRLSADAIRSQISRTDDVIKSIIGLTPMLFRPPYGSINPSVQAVIPESIFVLWNVDTLDWKNRNKNTNLKNALAQVQDGSIILFHDIYQPSVDTVEPLIKNLKSQGYEFVTVGELLRMENKDINSIVGKKCSSKYVCH